MEWDILSPPFFYFFCLVKNMANKVKIISDAFVLLGKQAINVLDYTNPIHVAASSIYDTVLPDLLCKAPWRYTVINKTLNRINDTPNNNEEWQYEFELPDDPKILLLYKTYPEMDYQIYQNRLYCNELEVKVDYVYQSAETEFPPYFVSLMVYSMTFHLAMAVTQTVTLVQFWQQRYEQQKTIAEGINGNQIPSQIIGNDIVYKAHFS